MMVLLKSERQNRCNIVRNNSVKYRNSNTRSVFKIYTQDNADIAYVKASKCIPKQLTVKGLPKKLMSIARFTTHSLPSRNDITHSKNKQAKNFLECYSVAAAFINNCCERNCSTSCEISFGCNKRKMKKQQSQLKPIPQFSQLYNSLKTAATNVKSFFSPSFKFRHRRYTSNTITNPVNPSSILNVINSNSSHQSSVAIAATTKSIPHMSAATTTNTVANKKSATLKKRKSLPSTFAVRSLRFRPLSGLKLTSLFSLLTFVCLETVLLSTVSNCAKTFYMHWNTSNSIFRIDNTDHIIDVNKGNLAFEFDQVHIICPVYEPGTFENETEKYIIYNVSKVEYETCRITNADPRVIAICDKPQKLMFFTITFRPFTPQPGGLEFLPGNDYYFISTSSKDDLYRRIGGRCSTNNMKVVFKVCCAAEDKTNKTITSGTSGGRTAGSGINGISTGISSNAGSIDSINNIGANGSGDMEILPGSGVINQQHINSISRGMIPAGGMVNINNGVNVGVLKPLLVGGAASVGATSGSSINTNIDQFNRIPMQTNGFNSGIGNGISAIGLGSHGSNGILLTPAAGGHSVSMIPGAGGIGVNGQYPGHQQTGIRINNVPSQHPSHKNNNGDDHFNKHPNEVVKNEELTYNSAASPLQQRCLLTKSFLRYKISFFDAVLSSLTSAFSCIKTNDMKHENNKFRILDVFMLKYRIFFSFNPISILSLFLVLISTNMLKFQIRTRSGKLSCSSKTICKVSLRKSKNSSYLPSLSRNCSPSLNENILKDKCTNVNASASFSCTVSKNAKTRKLSHLHDLKNSYRR